MSTELRTDSYKLLSHWNMYPAGTEYVYSYFESRMGALFPETTVFSLQYILKRYFVGKVVTRETINEARFVAACHANGATEENLKPFKLNNEPYYIKKTVLLGIEQNPVKVKVINPKLEIDWDEYYRKTGQKERFNIKGWEHILKEHGGTLPLRIKAVPEGTPVPVSNILMSVENLDPKLGWLTNYVESVLTHVWYGSAVASLSRTIKIMLKGFLDRTSDNPEGLDFGLHDFGYRGVSSDESAEVGGAAHLINFLGTDTDPALPFIVAYYDGEFGNLAFSVPASEHSIMTSLGDGGEAEILDDHLLKYPDGILSEVIDSEDPYYFIKELVCKKFKARIEKRNGVFVVRPDSITPIHPHPEQEVLWIVQELANTFGYKINSKGFMTGPGFIKVLWGDGIDMEGVRKIYQTLEDNMFSADWIATNGMGGGLLQKLNRDTQRSAFKSSAQCRFGVWRGVSKKPKDLSKASKRGRLKLIYNDQGKMVTVLESEPGQDILQVVFERGELFNEITYNQIRINAKVK